MSLANPETIIAKELTLPASKVNAAIGLLDEGNTIPFIARYRKEVTGGLDEVQLRQVQERLEYLRKLAERKDAVRSEIESQGKLSPELAAQLEAAAALQGVEDLYRPYKPKRRTRAAQARERGLEPLAQAILAQERRTDVQGLAGQFLSDGVADVDAALAGARDIIAEQVSDDPTARHMVRQRLAGGGFVVSQRNGEETDPDGRYRMYYDFRCALRTVQPHQWLALQRGEKDGSLRVRIEAPDGGAISDIEAKWITAPVYHVSRADQAGNRGWIRSAPSAVG